MDNKFKNLFIKFRSRYDCYKRRKKLIRTDFTIISNNCWGGFVYQYYGMKYLSPTIGLFFVGNDYIKFCKNIEHYINQKLIFIPFEKSKNYDIIKGENRYPIARLDDIEIYFMHYKTEEEAAEKWYRRCKRINFDNIIFKVSQREKYTKEDMVEFINMKDKKLICFTYDDIPNAIVVKELEGFVGDEMPLVRKYYDDTELLNSLMC